MDKLFETITQNFSDYCIITMRYIVPLTMKNKKNTELFY